MGILKNWRIGRDIAASIKAGNFTYIPLMLDFAHIDEKEHHAYAGHFLEHPEDATTILNGLTKMRAGVRFMQFCNFLADRAQKALAMVPEETFANFTIRADLNAQQSFGELLAGARKVGAEHKVLSPIKQVLKDRLTKPEPVEGWALQLFGNTRPVPQFPSHMVEGLMKVDPAFVKETIKEAIAEAIQEGRWLLPGRFIHDAIEHKIAPYEYLTADQVTRVEEELMGKPHPDTEDVQTYSQFVGAIQQNQYLLSGLSTSCMETVAVYLNMDLRKAFESKADIGTQSMKSYVFNNFMQAVRNHPDVAVEEMIVDTLQNMSDEPRLNN